MATSQLRYIHKKLLVATTSSEDTDFICIQMSVSICQRQAVATKIGGKPLVFHGAVGA